MKFRQMVEEVWSNVVKLFKFKVLKISFISFTHIIRFKIADLL